MFGRGGTTPACLPLRGHAGILTPVILPVWREGMSFFDSSQSSYSPDEARSRLFYVQHHPFTSDGAAPHSCRAAQQCRACQCVRKNGKGRVGGHLAAQARPPELHRTFGRLHVLQGTGTLLYWAAGSGKMVGCRGFHIIPSHPPPIRSFGDGVLSRPHTTHPAAGPGDEKENQRKENHTRQLSMEAWFQSFLFRPPSPPGVPSVCGQGPQ